MDKCLLRATLIASSCFCACSFALIIPNPIQTQFKPLKYSNPEQTSQQQSHLSYRVQSLPFSLLPQPGIIQPSNPAPPPNLDTSEQKSGNFLKACLRPRGQFPSNDCSKYINCWDNVAVEEACPEGLLFNPKGYCDFPANVNCATNLIPGTPPPVFASSTITTELTIAGRPSFAPTSPQVPSTPPTATDGLSADELRLKKKCLRARGQFPSDSCNRYVNCWDDVVVEQECPEGLIFSEKGYCDYPHKVDCQNRLLSDGVENSPECPISYGTFRDRFNCSIYHTCVGGKVIATNICGAGTSYSDILGVCDYSERVTTCNNKPLVFDPSKHFFNNVPGDYLEKIDNCKTGEVLRLNPQCSIACVCYNTVAKIILCPAGMAYDSKTDKCLIAKFAKC